MSEITNGAGPRESEASEALSGNGFSTQSGTQDLESPPDLRLQRTAVTPYDLIILVLLLIVVAAYFGMGWATSRDLITNGEFSQVIILGLIPAILLYHFLDTRARFIKGWITIAGAGAIAATVWFGFRPYPVNAGSDRVFFICSL